MYLILESFRVVESFQIFNFSSIPYILTVSDISWKSYKNHTRLAEWKSASNNISNKFS